MGTSTVLVAWVARHVLPAEPALRRWLRGVFPGCDVDDVVQETYCRLAAVRDLDRIEDPRRYLFQTARNVVLVELRRQRVVRIEAAGSAADMEAALAADELSPDRVVGGRWLLERVDALLAALPERARTAIRLRKLDGLSQRQIAERLGVTETVVENDLSRGLRALLAGLSEGERAELPMRPRAGRRVRVRR
ncbi:RNA polymerase sigma factor [Sphingomonas rubra]|uniref:RNA polymerase sigma-70 factor, ECF subfamily n=1 Tax=Sphingomonas rubra TaxID=634430 RepID=A0A1I5RH57_9SPHN|nr:sigma-70 family RNA polymerase sigma factor [Sphingomonas rubra]SFP57266.1 RNA polymerase sigma-70 factor, ECF subfamily [Sphingomonas rubra]